MAAQKKQSPKKKTVGNNNNIESEIKNVVEKKDPNLALILGLVGAIPLVALPGIGHIYMGMTRKGIVYCVASLLVWGVISIAYMVISFITLGIGSLCFPIFIFPILFNLAVVYDLYKITRGEKPLLPDF